MNKRKKIRLGGLLSIAMAAALTISSWGANSDLVVTNQEEAKKGVVVVENAKGGYGSGFAVGIPGEPVQYFVTNQHVVGNYTTATICYSQAENKRVKAHVVARDLQKDLALLKIPSPTTERAALKLCELEFVEGKFTTETYYALGYPNEDYQGSEYVTMDENSVSATSGIISATDTIDGRDVYRVDVDINQGNSGGPLVNSRGEVIGIASFIMKTIQTDAEGGKEVVGSSNCAVIVDQLINLLEDNRVKYVNYTGETEQEPEETKQEPEETVQETEETARETEETKTPAGSAESESSQDGKSFKNSVLVPILIGSGFFILVLVVVLLVIMNLRGGKQERKQQEKEKDQEKERDREKDQEKQADDDRRKKFPATQPVESGEAMVISGVLRGTSAPISGRLLIGRDDSRCQLAFPHDCPGVSGVHCEIYTQNGKYYLRDLDSSYGTFLSDGTRLSGSITVALDDGDTFYLADKSNTIEVHL